MENKEENFLTQLRYTFAWELLGESGSPKEGQEELLKLIIQLAREAYEAGWERCNENVGKLLYGMQSNPPMTYDNVDQWLEQKGIQ